MAAYQIAVMNEDIGKFGCDSMQQIAKKRKIRRHTSLRIVKAKFLTSDVFIFYKNLLCRERSSCLRHDVNNSIKCK